MQKLKQYFLLENGMTAVNVLFFLSAFLRGWLSFAAHLCWIVCLVCCIRNSSSGTAKIIYKILIGYAALMIAVNLYFMITAA